MMLVLIWIVLSLFLLTPIVVVYALSGGTGEQNELASSPANTTADATGEAKDKQSNATDATGTALGEEKENPSKAANAPLQLEQSKFLTLDKNGNLTINKNAVINNPARLPFNFIMVKNATYGVAIANGSLITYTPKYNYTGPDSFSFRADAINKTTKKPIHSNTQDVTITVEPTLIFNAPPEIRAALAFGLSLVVVFLIFLIAFLIIRKTRRIGKKIIKTKFWDIVRDDNWYPSLAIFQFLMWTGIVLFGYFGIALLRFFSGVGPFTDISENILYVMGISAVTTGTSTVISRYRYGGSTPPNVQPTKEIPSDEVRKSLPRFRTMLMENGKITLTRFQMFAWTSIGVIAYLGLLYLVTFTHLGYIENLSLPTLPSVFIILMGISEFTYLGDKSAKPKYFSINEVRPGKVRLKEQGNNITVLGSNFGDAPGTGGTVWLEYYPPLTKEEKEYYCPELSEEQNMEICEDEFRYDQTRLEEQFDVTPDRTKRENNRIVVSLDSVKDKLKPGTYVVRVESNGLLTYAGSDATFDITYVPTPTPTPTPMPTPTPSTVQKKEK